MADRPWVTPDDVIAYTAHAEVAARATEKLEFDIARAELVVIAKTNNKFESYETIPEPVKMAVILLAEAYAKNTIESTKTQIKSETFDDYSYTADSATIDIDNLGLDDLLSPYVLSTGRGKAVMKLRRL